MTEKENLILLDMDGVLVDVNPKHLKRVNERFGTDYGIEDLIRFNYYDYLPEQHARYLVEESWQDPELYHDLPIAEGAEKGIEALRELARVVVVSSPMTGHASSKMRWLMNHGFSKRDFVLTSDKTLVERMCPGALLIDDGPAFLKQHEGPKIIVDRPWNRHLEDSKLGYDTYRAHSWDEIVSFAQELHADLVI
jgi:5'(3')-deoxyribonucleotidase